MTTMTTIPQRLDETPAAFEAAETIWDLIEQQRQAGPERTAIVDGTTEIDYRGLVDRSNAIAGELVDRGVPSGSLVGVCLERGSDLVATLLGVLRAGCAYVPLDPAYPRDRVRYILEHSRAAVAIVDHESRAELCVGVPEILRLDEVGERSVAAASRPTAPRPAAPRPAANDLAYVMYTSGSTGRPKGVAIEHRGIVALSRYLRTLLDDDELAGMLASASICFDASVLEIFGTLSLGGTVVMAENVLALLDLPAADRVRSCVMVPSALQSLLAAGRLPNGIRCILVGGEVLKPSLVGRLHALEPVPRVVNVYGPTEDTVFSTTAEITPGIESITIGRSIPGSRAYILDADRQPVAVGVAGELHLAGDKLARGYLHDDELTRQRFLEVTPSDAIPEERLYRTGDLCRWRDDGQIEFLSRLDQQVKIRGYRIELEEIESALESMPGIDGAAVAVADGAGDQKKLVGYLVSRDPHVTRDAARAFLEERLPAYMVPRDLVRLDELPRLPSGKLDRKSLPEPPQAVGGRPDDGDQSGAGAGSGAGGVSRRLAELPRDEARAAVVSILRGEIASLLRYDDPEQVSLDQSLLELGLDSLTIVELSSRLAAILGHKLPVAAMLERSTPVAVADLALDAMTGQAAAPATPTDRRVASQSLASFQSKIQAVYPPFLAAKAPSWSATDKGVLVKELKQLVSRPGDPFCKLVRTGSGHRGVVADVGSDAAREALIWTTNLYLGLNRDPEVIDAAREALERFGTGMGTSAAASGITDLHLEFEAGFAELVGKPAACLFPTGYTANVGAVAGVLGLGDVVIMDQLCHASIVDGARLCGATIRTFQHNDPADLEAVLETEASPYRTILVVLEGVYSMGEGAAPVADIARIAKQYGALVLVDEAHSFGFYGPRGAGICAERGVTEDVDFIMTTLSKALGSLGGVVAASAEHVDLLKSSSRAFIFQASTSPADIAAALAALRRLRDDDSLRERLWDTTAYMRRRFTEAGYDLGTGDGPIVTPHFSDKDKLFAIVNGLFERGVHTSAVTYPIVETGRGRLRFICSAAHSRDDVDTTLQALIDAEREAEAALQHGRVEPSLAHPGRPGLEAWADRLVAYLRTSVARRPGQTPDLAVSFGLSENDEPITIVFNEREVSLGTVASPDVASCSLWVEDSRAAAALCASDLQGLLESFLSGTCVVSGQVEPFVWLIGRLADWQRKAIGSAASD